MRQESNHRTNSGRDNRITISNSRAMGVIVLIALLFVFQVTTFVLHKVRVAPAVRFSFNPNTISKDSLQLLGFTEKQAQSIINYREKGGRFRKREDFAKLYVVDSAMYSSLAQYILLPDRYVLPAEIVVQKNVVPGTKRAAESDFVQKKADSSTKLGRREEIVQKNGNYSTKLAGGEEIVQNKGKFSTKPVGKVIDAGRDAGQWSRQEAGQPDRQRSNHQNKQRNIQQDRQRSLDTLYGRKVVRNRYMCNLNTADSAALVQLYGIGGYYASRILKYREQLGGSFVSPRQLLEIEGVTQERYSKIEKNIFVREEDVKGFSILGADRKTLERHPYIGPYAARGILTYLRLKGIPEAGTAPADQNGAASKSPAAAEVAFDANINPADGKALSKQAETELAFLKELVKERILTQENARKLEEYLLHL